MIHSKRGLLLVAVLCVIVALTVTLPARIAYRWLSPAELTMSGIQGSVWRGSASAAGSTGIYLGDLTWRISPLQLFAGKANYSVTGSPASGFVEGNIGVSISGTLTVSDLAAALPLDMFAEALNIRGLAGNASLQFERIQLRDGVPVAATGNVQISNLVAPRLSRDSIGGYRAEFFTQNNGVSASIEDTDGLADIAGSLQVNNDGSYQFVAQVVAKPGAPATLHQQVQRLGPANERGQRELRAEGIVQLFQ